MCNSLNSTSDASLATSIKDIKEYEAGLIVRIDRAGKHFNKKCFIENMWIRLDNNRRAVTPVVAVLACQTIMALEVTGRLD